MRTDIKKMDVFQIIFFRIVIKIDCHVNLNLKKKK